MRGSQPRKALSLFLRLYSAHVWDGKLIHVLGGRVIHVLADSQHRTLLISREPESILKMKAPLPWKITQPDVSREFVFALKCIDAWLVESVHVLTVADSLHKTPEGRVRFKRDKFKIAHKVEDIKFSCLSLNLILLWQTIVWKPPPQMGEMRFPEPKA